MHVFICVHMYVTILNVCQWGFELDIGFIDHFNTQLVITLNYSATANFHTHYKITRAHTKSFPACSVFISSCLITAPTMAIPLLPSSSPLWIAAPFQLRILAPTKSSLHRLTDQAQSEPELLYDWQFTTSQSILAPSTLRTTTSIFFSIEHLLL
jgi:hypothetical protein